MVGVGIWAKADCRRRRRSLLALVLLAGVAGGIVMAATAGARRTATSLERLAATSRSADALVDVGPGGAAAARAIGDLPSVQQASAGSLVFAVIDGVSIDVGMLVPFDGDIGRTIERDRLLRGRQPDPDRPDEVLLDETTARLLALDVGDALRISTLTPEQIAAERYYPPEGPVLPVHVTGVSRGVEDVIGREEGFIRGTPAMQELIAGRVDIAATYVAIELRAGAGEAQLERELAAADPGQPPPDVLSFDVRTAAARRTVSALAAALAAFAAGAALTTVVIVGQAMARHVEVAADDSSTLRALGVGRRHRVLGLAATVLPVAVLAPAVAMAVAVAGSSLTPIGLARRAEPSPGVRVDPSVLLLGALAVAALVAVAAGIAALRSTGRAQVVGAERPSSVALAAARAGARPALVNGIALALHRRRPGAAAQSTLLALTAAIAGAAALVTFTASADRLVGDSDRWGSPWDLALDFTSAEVDDAAQALVEDPTLDAVSRWDAGQARVDGSLVRAYTVQTLRGDLGFSLLSGRQPGPGEVVLGSVTAARTQVEAGDTVEVGAPDGTGGTARLRVAGIGVFPEIDEGDFEDAVGMTPDDFAAHAVVADLYEASQVVVRVGDGDSVTEAARRLEGQFGDSLEEPFPVRPGVVGNLADVRSIPRALLAFVALLGMASLVHAVRSTLRRRAPHFATLRAIGMTPRQLAACSTAMVLTVTAIALAVGLPLGIAAGRGTWRALAEAIGVAGDALVPAGPVGAIVLGGVVLAVMTGAVFGRPGRRRAALLVDEAR